MHRSRFPVSRRQRTAVISANTRQDDVFAMRLSSYVSETGEKLPIDKFFLKYLVRKSTLSSVQSTLRGRWVSGEDDMTPRRHTSGIPSKG